MPAIVDDLVSLAPFVARVYGEDFPRLSYVRDLKADLQRGLDTL